MGGEPDIMKSFSYSLHFIFNKMYWTTFIIRDYNLQILRNEIMGLTLKNFGS